MVPVGTGLGYRVWTYACTIEPGCVIGGEGISRRGIREVPRRRVIEFLWTCGVELFDVSSSLDIPFVKMLIGLSCLLLMPLVMCSHSRKPSNLTNHVVSTTTKPTTDSELQLPPPSLLYKLYETTAAVLDATWPDRDTDPRQVNMPGGNVVITLSTFIAMMLATVFGVVGFGSVGLLAAKALAVGTLALFLTALSSLKHKGGQKSDSGGQTVHFVPIQSGGGSHHHEYFHDRGDFLPPYLTYADYKA